MVAVGYLCVAGSRISPTGDADPPCKDRKREKDKARTHPLALFPLIGIDLANYVTKNHCASSRIISTVPLLSF
jgi:hypothetical protein